MEATCESQRPTLAWATATERNSSHFIIERSGDAWDWKNVGEVAGAGYSQQVVEYHWLDPEPQATPVVYYRLRQVDRDGREELFDVMPLLNCSAERATISVFPVPADQVLNVVVHTLSTSRDEALLVVRDAAGRPVFQRRMALLAGQGRAQLDLDEWHAGIYLLDLLDDAGNLLVRTRLVKE